MFADCLGESHTSKEFWNAREQTDAGHVMLFRLPHEGFDQQAATAGSLAGGGDSDGADLRQVSAIKM